MARRHLQAGNDRLLARLLFGEHASGACARRQGPDCPREVFRVGCFFGGSVHLFIVTRYDKYGNSGMRIWGARVTVPAVVERSEMARNCLRRAHCGELSVTLITGSTTVNLIPRAT
jgi:hypothetical protein